MHGGRSNPKPTYRFASSLGIAVRFSKRIPGANALRRLLPAWVRSTALDLLERAGYGRDTAHEILREQVNQRLLVASQRESEQFERITSVAEWHRFLSPRMEALRDLMGGATGRGKALAARSTRRYTDAGVVVENLVFESGPHDVITANLYRSEPARSRGPGILVCHSHHASKTQVELQEMGAAWARAGCVVLIMDLVGHGERRTHPFHTLDDYPQPFRVARQDYWFRYNTGMQLYLAGESLMAWMASDAKRGIDFLTNNPNVDPNAIVVVGAVAGGGDIAAVTAALDSRVAVTIPFNFGQADIQVGPSGEYDGQNQRIMYSGIGSWESSRSLLGSARHGFTPWVILASLAPRRLVYAHEFGWEPERDPVWQRLLRVYSLFGAEENLSAMHGRGRAKGRPPHNTHCTNVGALHRSGLAPVLDRWLGIKESGDQARERPEEDLECLSPDIATELEPWPVHRLADRLAAVRLRDARDRLARSPDPLAELRRGWTRVLGGVEPLDSSLIGHCSGIGGWSLSETCRISSEPGSVTVIDLFRPPKSDRQPPVVVGFAQEGAQALLRARGKVVRGLVEHGAAVALVQPRGTGTAYHDDDTRGRHGVSTEVAASELMLGETLLGTKLRDCRSALAYLRERSDIDTSRLILWGDSLAPPNPATATLEVPFDVEPFPRLAEPLGGLLALLGGLFEPDVRAVYVHRGLVGFSSILESPFCYLPFDVIVPGVLRIGDLRDIVSAISPRPVRLIGLVDGRNQIVSEAQVEEIYGGVRDMDSSNEPGGSHSIFESETIPELLRWMTAALRLGEDSEQHSLP